MRQEFFNLEIKTFGQKLYEFTNQTIKWIRKNKFKNGMLNLSIQHTSASLIVQENADPDVRHDLEAFFARLVPDGDALYRHTDEGPDDMPSHVRTALTASTLSIPVSHGALGLGTWQGIYLCEHRDQGGSRTVVITLQGE